MVRKEIRLPDDLSERIRAEAYRRRISQNGLIVEILQRELAPVVERAESVVRMDHGGNIYLIPSELVDYYTETMGYTRIDGEGKKEEG